MAGKVDNLSPSSTQFSLSPQFPHMPAPQFDDVRRGQYFRAVSLGNSGSTVKPTEYNVGEENVVRWRTALQCKTHVGTTEWVKCEQPPCVDLRKELHHLLECRYKVVGGCDERCLPLRKELQIFAHSSPKYPTISHTQFGHRHHNLGATQECVDVEGKDVQAKLQALTIERFVSESTFSPNSPQIDEPFQLHLKRDQKVDDKTTTVPVVELVPLDKTSLSVIDGCFRRGHEWERVMFLGKGTFGRTYLCLDNSKKDQFAIKKLREADFHADEVEIWKSLNDKHHPNILKLFGAVKSKERILIFMEYMHGGSVGDYLNDHGSLSEKNALYILYQVLDGLQFMHRNNIVHGDVKGGNVLMDESGFHVKLADFGCCVNLNSIEMGVKPRLAGTLAFMAPETCRSEMPSFSADIWSAMCFLLQMLSGEAPWAEYRHQSHTLNPFIIGTAKRGPNLPECSTAVRELFAQGFRIEACSRPSAAQLLSHRAFDVDYDPTEPSSTEPEFHSDTQALFPMIDSSSDKDECSLSSDASIDWVEPTSLKRPEFRRSPQDHFLFTEMSRDHSLVTDSSLEYHSCDLSGDEYLSSTDDFNTPENRTITASSFFPKEKSVTKRVDDKGGRLVLNDTLLTIPPNALNDAVQLAINCLDSVNFYQPLINHDLYDKVTIVGDVHQLSPSTQNFLLPVAVRLSLPGQIHQSENVAVLQGSLNEHTRCITWEDVTESSTITPFRDSFTVDVNIDHFSFLMVVKSLPWAALNYLTWVFNASMFFRFLILVREDPEVENILDARLVMIRESFYLSSSLDAVDQYSVCRRLKDEGFRLMYGSRREYVAANETLGISLETSAGVSLLSDDSYVVQFTFGGEEVCNWRLDCSKVDEPLSGTVTIRRVSVDRGPRYSFQIWEHEPIRYVQQVLQLDTLTFANILAIAKAINLSEAEIMDLVDCGKEEEQLRRIREIWEEKAEHNELGDFSDFVSKVPKSAILVSDRGKFHLGHLVGFKEKWDKKEQRKVMEDDENFYQCMAKLGKDLCQLVVSDCLLQIDHSEDAICKATKDLRGSFEVLLEHAKQHYPVSTRHFIELVRLLNGDNHTSWSPQIFCQTLYRCLPWLTQIVKDIFKVDLGKPPSGMWGMVDYSSGMDMAKTTEEKLQSNETWCRICELLRKICEFNLRQAGAQDAELNEVIEMEHALKVHEILEKICIVDKEWEVLKARVKYYGKSVKEITRNTLCEMSQDDLQNILIWLQRYVQFCPTKLVQFTFSVATVSQEPLKYDQNSKCFTQKFILPSEDDARVCLKININVNGLCFSDDIDVVVKICEQTEETHNGCRTVNVRYQHDYSGSGFLKVINNCQKLFVDRAIESRRLVTEPDGGQPDQTTKEVLVDEQCLTSEAPMAMAEEQPVNESMAEEQPVNESMAEEQMFKCTSQLTPVIKQGCPSDSEIAEIAHNVPGEWKPLGRILLGNENTITGIDIDELPVAEKAMAMLKNWKQKSASFATYEVLYRALCSNTVSRNDLGENYCLVRSDVL